MSDVLLPRAAGKAVLVVLVSENEFGRWLRKQPARTARWLKAHDFAGKPGSFCVVPDASGKPVRVVAGLSQPPSLWDIADLPVKLPAGTYRLEWDGPLAYREWLALGWALGTYRYARYKKRKKEPACLVLAKDCDAAKILRYASAINRARDLINTPAEDMGPAELAAAIVSVGKKYKAKVTQIIGEDLRRKNYPAIHTVGRASSRAPRLVDLVWGNPRHPKVTLAGKGVCFDTGGLDLKSANGMYLMKKDMGGAACALAVAEMVMDAKLPVRLRLLIPAVENAVSGNAYRPSDIIRMRNGLTVEVGNTDAEGRLILADALAEAASEKPGLLIDFSTLTGAARTAVGAEIAALFCDDDRLAEDLCDAGRQMEDPLWRLPLYAPYEKMIESRIADLNSAPNSPYAGAITAALFLKKFAGGAKRWAHLDFMAWNLSSKPGRPEGGEAMAVRAAYRAIEQRAGKPKK
ncbi:MAG TPA: leucyl aminopeptidase family protein [Alphaproteobacteria bacterium]|nr:leucyl aminopeptidase family protein [Alphaproteobacteria bacterium]